MNETDYQKQLNREKQSADAGYKKLLKQEEESKRNSNGSNTIWSGQMKSLFLQDIVDKMQEVLNGLNAQRASGYTRALNKCLHVKQTDTTYSPHDLFDLKQTAFIGLQLALDTALNPNQYDHNVQSKYGGEKKLLQKKSLNELENQIGRVINEQMSLRLIELTFPNWFRGINKKAEKSNKDGMKSSTSYWSYRMNRAMREYAEWCRDNNRPDDAEIIENRRLWSYQEQCDVGAFVLKSVISATGLFQTSIGRRGNKKSTEIHLTPEAQEKQKELMEMVKNYAHDVLPMVITPEPITNDNLGGWLCSSLQEQQYSRNGQIELSDKHLEFINRQARVKFQINPFIYALMEVLIECELPLGKFHYTTLKEIPSVAQQLGYGMISDEAEKTRLVQSNPDAKAVRSQIRDLIDINKASVKKGMIARLTFEKAKQVVGDDHYFIPMKYDFRGRIYSRVPFLSFQSNDAGRYLNRFAEKTPIDNRTEFWMKVGVANAAGCDKLSWDKRIAWFDKNKANIINVGRMLTTGDFNRAYEFLTSDEIDDPFQLAAIADEYVKVFVDKTQDYTQVFVCVDCSCSGTSIFNAWRRNLSGARLTNLVDTPTPADIYSAVWDEIERLAPEGTFRKGHIKRLKETKFLRKMMKQTYVPASYASPPTEQKLNLKRFNNDVLKKNALMFTDDEMTALCDLWVTALDNVSNIITIVEWFQSRCKEAFALGANQIKYTSANGSVMTLKYPKTKQEKVRTLHYGSGTYREKNNYVSTDECNTRKLLSAITANVTHLTDAAALCDALWDAEHPFMSLHDAVGLPPGKTLDNGVRRLKEGIIHACEHPVFDVFRSDNGLPIEPQSAAPVIGDLDLDLIKHSNYLFS